MLTIVRTRLRSAAAAFALLTSTLSFPLFAATEEPITWRVQSHWPGASSSFKDSLVRLKDTLEARSDGRLQLQLFEAGSLFSATETFNAVSRGIMDMGTISPAYAQNKVSLAGIASGLPFAFREVWEAAYFHKNMGFEDMLRAEAAEHNVYWATDKVYPTEMVLKRPINGLGDLRGLKIRSSGSMQRFLTDAGATASYIPGSELYTALDAGIVDGAHWGASLGANSMGLYEVAKYHVYPALTISGTDVFIVSQRSLDRLPEDLQRMVKQALEEQFWFRTNEYMHQERRSITRAIETHGVQLNTLPDDVQQHLSQVAMKQWEKEGERSDNTQKALSMLKEFLGELGYL